MANLGKLIVKRLALEKELLKVRGAIHRLETDKKRKAHRALRQTRPDRLSKRALDAIVSAVEPPVPIDEEIKMNWEEREAMFAEHRDRVLSDSRTPKLIKEKGLNYFKAHYNCGSLTLLDIENWLESKGLSFD